MTTRTQTPALFAPGAPALVRARQTVVGRVLAALYRQRTRNRLALLDDRMLRDIGLDPVEAETEIAKPFWRD
ncbi:DUF1127 domain-containing protein [Neotabrizicola shimadae]|uniref:DUF1127 domain-containing protein n=1 Tax=Neotabrizicola shimadae TaxID=2807096 RepID=A0A8G1ECV0_9RHOB|nr:DUF1127 domain-containing protein [Neotabrizicola shimadae]QYZ70842.1 DUF1127 domain-containing protein [Neotabrizicola shimadae]